MLLWNRKLGSTNNHNPGPHCLQLTFSPRNFLIETFKLYASSWKVFTNNENFFQQLDKKCFKIDAKENLIRMKTNGCFLLTRERKKNFKIKHFSSTTLVTFGAEHYQANTSTYIYRHCFNVGKTRITLIQRRWNNVV